MREVVLGLHGKAGNAVLGRLSEISHLTQLHALELIDLAVDVPGENFTAALAPLTQLTRLGVHFSDDHTPREGIARVFPFENAISSLVHLQELRATSDNSDADGYRSCCGMFTGSLPAALSRLTALRHLELCGMAEWVCRDDWHHLQL